MEACHLLIEGLRDLGDGGGTDGVLEELGQHRANLAGGKAAQEDAADKLIDLGHAPVLGLWK